MEWSNLKIVLAIGRGGSMTAAANLLQIDQTTIGRRLNALEAELGCTLFVRSKAGFVATDQGEIVLDYARKCEFDLNDMQDRLQAMASGVSGIIRLVANPWMLQFLAAQPFLRLSKRHPALELRMSGRLPPVPVHSESTLSLWFDAPALPTDVAIPFCKIPFATYRAFGVPEEGASWVQFRDDAATGPTQVRHVKNSIGSEDHTVLTATDASILLEAVKSGVGLGILPVHLATKDPALVPVQQNQIRLERVLHLHLNPDTLGMARVQAVVRWLEDEVEEAFGATKLKRSKQTQKLLEGILR